MPSAASGGVRFWTRDLGAHRQPAVVRRSTPILRVTVLRIANLPFKVLFSGMEKSGLQASEVKRYVDKDILEDRGGSEALLKIFRPRSP